MALDGRPGVAATLRDSPTAVKALLAGVFISRLAGFLNLFLVLFLLSRGYSAAGAATALGGYGIGAVLGVLVSGWLTDRLGARATTVIGMAGAGCMLAAILYLPGYGYILGASVLAGLAGQMVRPAASALLSELTPPGRQVMVFALYRFGLNLGATAAPLLGYGLYHLGGGYGLLFWGEASASLIYAVLAFVLLPARAARVAAEPGGGAVRGGYPAMLRDRPYLLFITAVLVHSAVYTQYLSTLPLEVSETHLSVLWYTLAVALNGITVIVLELPATKYTQTWPRRVPIGLACALLACGVALYGLPLTPAVILTGTLVWSIGEVLGGPTLFAYPAVIAPAELKSRYLGGFYFAFGLGNAIGPALGERLLAGLGRGAWPALAAIEGLVLLAMLTAVRPAQAAVPTAAAEQAAVG